MKKPAAISQCPELADLSHQVAEFIHYWGFKRIHGRIWTLLFLANRPLDASDLVRSLDISKALVSISLRELLDFNVIEEIGRGEKGTTLYRTNPDILRVIMGVLRQRERRLLSTIRASHQSLSRVSETELSEHELSPLHIQRLGDFIDRAHETLDSLLNLENLNMEGWKQTFMLNDLTDESELRAKAVVLPSRRKGSESPTAAQQANSHIGTGTSLPIPSLSVPEKSLNGSGPANPFDT